MAVTFTGTRNLIPSNQLPTGYTVPVVASNVKEFTSQHTLSILKATVDESVASTTMTAIFDNSSIGIDKQLEDIITAAFDNTKTIVAYGECTALTHTIKGTLGADAWLTDTAVSYTATVTVYTSEEA